MHVLRWLLLVYCLVGAPAGAQVPAGSEPPVLILDAATPVVALDNQSQFWIDPDGQATVATVAAAGNTLTWALRGPGAQHNIDGKALWIRFDVTAAQPGRWFLELASSGLDRVQLMHQKADGSWQTEEAGDSRAVSDWPVPGRFPTFELNTSSAQPQRYWLRVEHVRVNFATPIAVVNQSSLVASREREQFLLGGYFGLAALIGLVALANAVAYRDRNFAAYAAYVLAMGAGQLAFLGVGAQHVWTPWLKWNELATTMLPGISSAVGLWFVQVVTEPARFSRALDRFVATLIVAILAVVVADTAFPSRTTLGILMVLMVVALGLILVLIGLVWSQGDDPAIRVIALGFLPVVVLALFPIARGLNLIPISPLTRYGVSIGAALEMPILFYALSLRGTRRREAQVRAAALSRTDALTGLAHQRSLLARLDRALTRARTQQHQCALLLVRVTNHAAIVEEYGQEVGERALVLTASRLRRTITDVDMAARVDHQDFAILLEGPTNDVVAQSCATRVVASGLRTSEVLPAGVTLKFHVAMAILPDGQHDAAGSLLWLQGLVSEMGLEGRKSIRAANF
jgi:diguanylate cyclase (GGDEF)-like protein